MKMHFDIPRSAILAQLYLFSSAWLLCTSNTETVNPSADVKMLFGSSLTHRSPQKKHLGTSLSRFGRLALYFFPIRGLADQIYLTKCS